MLRLFVEDVEAGARVPVHTATATVDDLQATQDWQTMWTTDSVAQMPNKVALHRTDDGELLGLMSYEATSYGMAVEIVYMESARHSNANLLKKENLPKKYHVIAMALFAYAIEQSMVAGFGGVLVFKAKSTELLEYYCEAFRARPVAKYDPFRLVIWEDAAMEIISKFKDGDLSG